MAERHRVQSFDELLDAYGRERSKPEWAPVHLGFGSLDADMRGISPGQVAGFAARTAVGKSWALATIAENVSARRDAGVLILSLEMPGPEWVERQVAIYADVAPEQVEKWAKEGELGAHVRDFLERFEHVLVCEEAVRLRDLASIIEEARERLTVPLRLVVIDYLGMIATDGRDAYERASALGKGLKDLAKAERLAVVVAMQLSRAAGDGSQPVSLEMLRDSGVLEEALDFLIGAWRPGRVRDLGPVDAMDLNDVMRVCLLKNRKGADGRVVDLRFRGESRRLYEPAAVL